MQIRAANRQDEKNIQRIASEICEEFGGGLDLDGRHSDLRNVEQNFFGRDGIFLIAENEREPFGFAAASKIDDEACALRYICLLASWRRQGIGRQLVRIVLNHEQKLHFKNLRLHPNPFTSMERALIQDERLELFFSSCGFVPLSEARSPVEERYAGNYIFLEASNSG